MTRLRTSPARAFTLVEMMGVIVIFATLAAVISPVALQAAGAHRRAATQRDASERAGHALERIVRLLRECPPAVEGEPAPGISAATASSITLTDGAKAELLGTTLWLTPAGGSAAPLCADVGAFELRYRGADGVADTLANPQATQRIEIRLTASGFELRTIVFLRVAEGLE
jgi:prepilin-type N-terminal cleavage/methylation domain-containing protein